MNLYTLITNIVNGMFNVRTPSSSPSSFDQTRTFPDKPYQTGGTNETIDFTPVISDEYKKIIKSTVIDQPSQTHAIE